MSDQSDDYRAAYDLRHHFAFRNINRWIQNKQDVNAMLPYLSRYMGHASLLSTFYYIHFVPEFYPVYGEITKSLSGILPEVDA